MCVNSNVLTPTASDDLLTGFGAFPDAANWMKEMYFLGEGFQTAIIVIHQLPEVPETLWLRILGTGELQLRAISEISELSNLPIDDPLRITALELLYKLQFYLVVDLEQETETENRELIMAICCAMAMPHAPLFE